MMHDFVSVKDQLPENGQEVEVLRDFGRMVANHGHAAFGCRFGIERTRFGGCGVASFDCDMVSTGCVTHWRPVESVSYMQVDSAFLDDLVGPAVKKP